MSDRKNNFDFSRQSWPKQPSAERVVGERGRKELPPGTKGGENMKPDRHAEHKQHAFDSFCKKVLKCEACNGYREISRRKKHSIPFSELPEDAMEQLAAYDRYPWEYNTFILGGDVILIENDLLADALNALPQDNRDILLMYWFLEMADREIAERMNLARRTINNRRLKSYRLLKELMGGDTDGEHNMFSGLLVCADCGSNLHFHFNQGNPEIKYFNCSNYKGNRGTCTSTHYVRVDFLEEVVLGEIRRLTKFASLYEDEFVKAVIGHSQQAEQTDRKLKEKELRTLLARDEELDGLFERIYEDNVSGKLSDDRFAKMSRRYEDEQKELAEKIKKLRSEIEKQSSRSMTTDMFIGLVRKYTRVRKLTPRMLNELIEKIEVFNAEKIDGVWEQRLRIHYNCVGTIEIPTVLPLPIPEVSVNTRKGVVVNYAPCELAV